MKSRSKGYASMEYQITENRPNDLVRLDILPPHTSPYLPIPPHTSPHLPISPHLSPSLPIPPHISPYLPISPHASPYLPISAEQVARLVARQAIELDILGLPPAVRTE